MKKRFITLALVSALMLSATGCAKEPTANDELKTNTTSEKYEITIEKTVAPENAGNAELSPPTAIASDNIYNSTVPTNLTDDATFSITVEYINDEPTIYGGRIIRYDRNNAVDVITETFSLDEGMTLKMLSDELSLFGGLVETDATLSYSADEEDKFAYTGFGYNLGVSDDEFVDLYIEFEDESGNIIEDISMVDDNSMVKAIAVYEENIENVAVVKAEKHSDNRDIFPICKTPLRIKFNVATTEYYEVFLGRDKGYLHDNGIGALFQIDNESHDILKPVNYTVANNTNYTLITCSDKIFKDYSNTVILVRN